MGSSKSSNGGGGSSKRAFESKVEIPTPDSAKYILWCSNMSNNSIYDMGSKLNCDDNYQVFCIGLMAAVFFTLCIEIAVHSLEHHITNFVTLEILNKMYRELMVGFFLLFLFLSHLLTEYFIKDIGIHFIQYQHVGKS
jgi:hypothetical protein